MSGHDGTIEWPLEEGFFTPFTPDSPFGKTMTAIEGGDSEAVETLVTSPEGRATINERWRTELACLAAHHGRAECLRVLVKTGVCRDGYVCEQAAKSGQLSCLRLTHSLGSLLTMRVAKQAAKQGHAECLAFALQHGPKPDDEVLAAAVNRGHLGCVELLVARGLPKKPYNAPELNHCRKFTCLHVPMPCYNGYCGPDQMRCLQHLLDKGRSIDPGTLIWAARSGNVDCVRLLHSRGVPLWDCVWDAARPKSRKRRVVARCILCAILSDCQELKVLPFPRKPEDANHMLKALLYGSVLGAPLTQGAKKGLKAMRTSTRAVLLTFHAAGRLAQGPEASNQMAVPEALEQMAMHKALSQMAVPEASNHMAAPEASEQMAEPESSKQMAVPEASKQKAVPEASNQMAVQEALNQMAVQEASNQMAAPEASEQMAEPESPKQMAVPEASKRTAVPEASNQMAVQEALKQMAVQEASSQMAVPEAPNQIAVPEASEQIAVPEVWERIAVPEASQQMAMPEASVQIAVPKASIEMALPEASEQMAAPKASEQMAVPEASKQMAVPEASNQRAVWALMSRIPVELVEEILVLADFEIPESLRRSQFGEPPEVVPGRSARLRFRWESGLYFA